MKKIMISSVAAFALLAGFAGSASAVSATEIYTPSTGFLKYGSGMGAKVSQMSNVMAAQKALNVCTNSSLVVDGKFGKNTTGVFKAFQASKGIAQDGVIGPVTAGKLADCSVGTTGDTSTGSSSTLSGGMGDLQDVNVLSTYSNEKVKEGQSDAKVLAFEIEADNGSDLLISNVRLSFEQTGSGSKRMNKYIDGVKVWQGSKEVGSADTSDFSENSDVYSRAINLSNAVVKDGEKSKFYVSVDAISNIDSNDLGEDWDVTVDSIRFKDASGAIITDSSTGDLGNGKSFSFEDLTTSGDLELKVSKGTNSPIAQVVEADSVSDTPDVTLVEAKIKASGSDMAIDEIKFDVTPTGANSNEIVKEYKLMVDGKEIDSVDSPSIASTVTGYVTFTDLKDDFMIDKDDTVTVKLVADINDFESPFGNGDSIVASLKTSTSGAFSVEDENGDDVSNSDWTGSAVGEAQTFFEDGIMVKLVSTSAVKTAGDAQAPESDSGLFTITFDVTAFGSDVYVDKSAPDTTGGSGESDIDVTGTGTVTSEITSSTGADEGTNGYLVEEGTTERFVVSTNILATATGFFNVKLGSIAYALTDANATDYYTSDLGDFKTTSLNLTNR